MQNKNIVLIIIMVAILVATGWSVYRSQGRAPVIAPASAVAAPQDVVPAGEFFKKQYESRLKEEGNRTERVEKMLKEGKLSNRPARYWKEEAPE